MYNFIHTFLFILRLGLAPVFIYIQKCDVMSKQPQRKLFSMKYKFIKIMKISLAQIDKGLLCEPSLFAHYLNMFLRKS